MTLYGFRVLYGLRYIYFIIYIYIYIEREREREIYIYIYIYIYIPITQIPSVTQSYNVSKKFAMMQQSPSNMTSRSRMNEVPQQAK